MESIQEEQKRTRELSLKRNYTVYEPNPLFSVQDSMTNIWQHRFMRAYLCKVDPRDPNTYCVRFSLKEFIDAVGLKSISSVADLKKLARSMMKVDFDFVAYRERYGLVKKGSEDLIDVVNLFERFAITGNDKKGYIVEITPSRPMEAMLKGCHEKGGVGFVAYEVHNTLPMSKSHRMRLYELLKRYEGKGFFTVPLEDLKLFMGLKGKYKDVRNFNKLLKADLSEIQETTDIKATYTTTGKGKGGAISEYTFTIKAQKGKNKTETKASKPKKATATPVPGQTSLFAEPADPADPLAVYIELLPRSLSRQDIDAILFFAKKLVPEKMLFDHDARQDWIVEYLAGTVKKMQRVKNLKSEAGWLLWRVEEDVKALHAATGQDYTQNYSGYDQNGRRELDSDELAAIERLFKDDPQYPYSADDDLPY